MIRPGVEIEMDAEEAKKYAMKKLDHLRPLAQITDFGDDAKALKKDLLDAKHEQVKKLKKDIKVKEKLIETNEKNAASKRGRKKKEIIPLEKALENIQKDIDALE